MKIEITVRSLRPGTAEEVFLSSAVPRIGEVIRTRSMAAARVLDVYHDMLTGRIVVEAR